MFGLGMIYAFSLIALALGYIVCATANKETGFLKGLGMVIGVFVILASAYCIIDALPSTIKMKKAMGSSTMRQKMQQSRVVPSAPSAVKPAVAPTKPEVK